MLKNKKILFLILMVVLLLLIPNIVKADERTLSGVKITVPEPVIGNTVSTASDVLVMSVDKPSPNVVNSVQYTVIDAEFKWWESETPDGITFRGMSSTDKFKPNLKYRVEIAYKRPNDDKIPAIDGFVDGNNFYITVNGKNIDVTNRESFSPGSSGEILFEYDFVNYEFEKAKPEAYINTIDISVPNINAGNRHCDSSDIVVKANNSIALNVGEAFWYKYNSNTKKYEEFTGENIEIDSQYNVYIYFYVPLKYDLDNSVAVSVNDLIIDTSDEDVFEYGKAGSEDGFQVKVVYHIDTTVPVFYSILEGKDPTYTVGKDKTLTFKIDAPVNKFTDIFLDDEEEAIDPKNYEVKEGSTVVTFKEDYLKTLANGKHVLMFLFEDGYAISDLTIAGADSGAENKPINDTTKAPGKIPYAGGTLVIVLSSALLVIAGGYALKKSKDLKGI